MHLNGSSDDAPPMKGVSNLSMKIKCLNSNTLIHGIPRVPPDIVAVCLGFGHHEEFQVSVCRVDGFGPCRRQEKRELKNSGLNVWMGLKGHSFGIGAVARLYILCVPWIWLRWAVLIYKSLTREDAKG